MLHAARSAPRRSCPVSPASPARAGSPRRRAPAGRRAYRPARRCRGAACRCDRRRSRACPSPRRASRAGCRCCRSRRCRASCRAPRWRRPRSCPSRRRWAASDFGKMRRNSMTISAIVSSATLRVLENGALKTGMPMVRAAARSTWLVPTEKQPIAISERMPSMASAVNLGARADAEHADALQRRAQLRSVQRRRPAVDVGVAGRLQRIDGGVGDALEQQDAESGSWGAKGLCSSVVSSLEWNGH